MKTRGWAGLVIGLTAGAELVAQPARPPSAARPPNIVVFFCDNLGYGDTTLSVRSCPWKVFLPLECRRGYPSQPLKVVNTPARLYNVLDDPAEERDVAQKHADVLARLLPLAQKAQHELGDLDVPGNEVRPAGWVFQARPPLLSPH